MPDTSLKVELLKVYRKFPPPPDRVNIQKPFVCFVSAVMAR